MTSLYFVAIIPPEPIASEVNELKQEMAERFNSKRALKSPPHITLFPPYKGDEHWEKQMTGFLHDWSLTETAFNIKLVNFASFPNRKRKNPVIYVHNEQSEELNKLHKNLMLALREHLNLPSSATSLSFSPHMTIAFKDLSLEEYDRAWLEFSERKYINTFQVNKLSLLRFNNKENKWDVLREFMFKEQFL